MVILYFLPTNKNENSNYFSPQIIIGCFFFLKSVQSLSKGQFSWLEFTWYKISTAASSKFVLLWNNNLLTSPLASPYILHYQPAGCPRQGHYALAVQKALNCELGSASCGIPYSLVMFRGGWVEKVECCVMHLSQ